METLRLQQPNTTVAAVTKTKLSCRSRKREYMDDDDDDDEMNSLSSVNQTNNTNSKNPSSNNSSGTEENDSMRPLAEPRRRRRKSPRKRRRTTIVDAFNSIKLNNNSSSSSSYSPHKLAPVAQTTATSTTPSDTEGAYEDADSSQAVADAEDADENNNDGYSTTSSLGEDDDGYFNDGEYYDDDLDEESSQEQLLLSDQEIQQKAAERKVMLELVFGPESKFAPPKSSVDQKLDQLIQMSRQKAVNGENTVFVTQDDMSIGCSSFSSDSLSSMNQKHHKRTNSLPEMNLMETVDEEMDLD